ncbi:MAG: transcription-repair coupling factor, partial [Actinomycetia bacterium]|nr:transcription-repair coupling factor [Actinomycetes bacterium]
MSFQRLPKLVSDDPAITRLVGRASSVLAVAEPARAITLAALATASGRRPVLVVSPTTTEADRLARDLAIYLGPDEVLTFPAWETLPFERVSPNVETMGQRLRTIWHLQDPDRCPRLISTSIRALIQRLSPGVEELDPIIIGSGDEVDLEELTATLVQAGYRREHQVEHRGEIAVRGSIVDIFPSTADRPIRIDLWGDEVDRLCEFTVNDQRSSIDLAEVTIFGCRELTASEDVAKRAAELMSAEPWGREHWQRLADGEHFDGMESWVPWLTDEERVLPDLLQDDALIVLVEPRRMRDRGSDLLSEEVDLATSLARTWDAGGVESFPRLHVPFERLLAKTSSPSATITTIPEGPEVAVMTASGWDAPGEALAKRVTQLAADGMRVVVAADGAGSAARVHSMLDDWGVSLTDHGTTMPEVFTPGVHLVVTSVEQGFVLPEVGLAVLTESDLTGRRRAHRRARPRKRQSEGFFDDLSPGDYVVHHQHGGGRFGGMVKRAIGGHE